MTDEQKLTALQEQTIAAARFSARALVTVCAAILVLVLSAQPNPYKEAVAELTTLLDLNYREILSEYVIQVNPEVRRQIDLLRGMLVARGLNLSLGQGNALLTETKVQNSLMGVSAGNLLGLIDSDVTAPDNAVTGEVSNIASIEGELRQLLREKRAEIPTNVTTVWLDIDRPTDGAVAYIRWGGGRTQSGHISREMGAMKGSIEFEHAMTWLKVLSNDPEAAALVGKIDDRLYFLPKCKDPRIWNQVFAWPAADAKTYLAGLANTPEQSLEVFGLSIPRNRISWGAPLILLTFSAHLFIHIRYLIQVVPDMSNITFPWLPLMQVWGARLFAWFSFLVLPFASVIALAWTARAEDLPSLVAKIVFLSVTVVTVLLTFSAFKSPSTYHSFERRIRNVIR